MVSRLTRASHPGSRFLTSRRQGQIEPEGRPFPELCGEVNRTLMHLQHPVSHGQPDTASRLLGGEIKIEDLVANFRRYPRPCVMYLDAGRFVVAASCNA